MILDEQKTLQLINRLYDIQVSAPHIAELSTKSAYRFFFNTFAEELAQKIIKHNENFGELDYADFLKHASDQLQLSAAKFYMSGDAAIEHGYKSFRDNIDDPGVRGKIVSKLAEVFYEVSGQNKGAFTASLSLDNDSILTGLHAKYFIEALNVLSGDMKIGPRILAYSAPRDVVDGGLIKITLEAVENVTRDMSDEVQGAVLNAFMIAQDVKALKFRYDSGLPSLIRMLENSDLLAVQVYDEYQKEGRQTSKSEVLSEVRTMFQVMADTIANSYDQREGYSYKDLLKLLEDTRNQINSKGGNPIKHVSLETAKTILDSNLSHIAARPAKKQIYSFAEKCDGVESDGQGGGRH